jgi:hypothetical protein
MKPSDQDLRDGFDAIQGDMALHQRITGREVTPDANARLAASEFEKLEAQGVFERASEILAPPETPEQKFGRELQERRDEQQRTIDGKTYKVTRDNDQGGAPVAMDSKERELTVKALKRLHMLLGLEDTGILGAPSWKMRAVACCSHMATNPIRFAQEMDELLEASNRYFGDWKIDPDKKIFIDSAGA